MIEKMMQRFMYTPWIPFHIRFRVSYHWLRRYQGWKASMRSVFKVKQLPSFPAGENPFCHDSYHTGCYLGKNVLAMNTLGNIDEEAKEYIILVHIPTGQRLEVSFPKQIKQPDLYDGPCGIFEDYEGSDSGINTSPTTIFQKNEKEEKVKQEVTKENANFNS